MDMKFRRHLKIAMEHWIEIHAADEDWIDGYVYEDLAEDMALAAELVFDANYKGQKFAENQ